MWFQMKPGLIYQLSAYGDKKKKPKHQIWDQNSKIQNQ